MKQHKLPAKWKWATIEEVSLSVADGPFGSNLKVSDYVDNGIPVLQGKNITSDVFQWSEIRFISAKKAEELKRSKVYVGDHLLVKIGSIGYSAIVDDLNGYPFAIIPANLAKITPDRAKVDDRYLHLWLTSSDASQYLKNSASKTAQPALSLGKIKGLPIPLPPLPEQRRIAAVLDAADALRAKRRAALGKLDALLQSVFLEMFGDPVTNNNGWKVASLGSVMTEVYRYPTYYDISYKSEGVPEIRGELINENGSITIERTQLRFISSDTSKRFPRTILEEGDLVMSVRGTIGKIGIVPKELDGANITANMIRMAPDRSIVLPIYAWHFMKTDFFKQKLVSASSSTTIQTIKAPNLKSIPMFIPPLALQKRFAKQVFSIERLIKSYELSFTEIGALFSSLQQRAFRGELFSLESDK